MESGGNVMNKSIVLVEFIFLHMYQEIKGSAALFFGEYDVIPMTDEEILHEIKVQYGYNAIQILHKQRANV